MNKMDNKQKRLTQEQFKSWVDVLKSDKDRKHHEETMIKCIFSPFLFGKSYVMSEKWIKWGVEMKLFKDSSHPKEILDKLEGPYFEILDLVAAACQLVCKKLKETKAIDLLSVLILSEKTNKSTTYKDALKSADSNDFFSKIKKQLEATSNEKSEKIGFVLLLAIKQYSDYVVHVVVNDRDIHREMENLGPDDVKNFYRTKGNEAFKVGKFNDAVKYYSDAIKADRFNHILYSNRAQTNLNLRKFQEALCDARRAVILKPDWEKGHYRYAQAFYELGNIDKAKAVNRNGQKVCCNLGTANGANSYLQIQADKFSEKESEEDDVPELVDASSSSSDSAESEEETDDFKKKKEEPMVFPPERQEIDINVLQKILTHKHKEDEKERLKEEKKKEREERKKKQEAEDEEKRKKDEARRKKAKEEKEKQKEAERVKKAEKKRREEEKQLAEKARMEKLAAKHELEETLKQGSEAFLDKRGRQAVTFYQKAQDLINQSTEQYGGLREEDYVTFLYAWGMAGLESAIAKEVNDAVIRFDTMLCDHRHVRSPLAYYGRAFAYFKHCKFLEAFEPLDKCEKMAKKFKYVVETWPGTTQSIKETTRGQMEVAIENLRDRCKNPPAPDATCRHPDCPSRREIYLTDPEFKGYVSISCSEHCMIDYHVNCWKKAKSDWDEEIFHDKDVINKHCNTPDCLGEVIALTIFDSDGLPKVEAKGDMAKKEKEKVKTKGKNKSKHEKKKQKKVEAKKNSEKGQGDGERLDSVTSSQSDVAEELQMPRRVEKRDDDTTSSVSSRQEESTTLSNDGENDSNAQNISDIDDILDDDDLPIVIPDAAYVLKRDDMGEDSAAAKKSKPSKTKTKKKKAKASTDLNIQLQFVDDGQRSLMTSDDVMSPDAKKHTPYTPNFTENPFQVPQHLREQATNFERSLPSQTFTQTVIEGQSFADMAKNFDVAKNFMETDEEKSQKIAILFHLSDLFDRLGPVVYNDPRLEMELDKLPEAQPVITRYGGLCKFLLQSKDFFVLEDHVSSAKDAMKCHEVFTERNNLLQQAGLPPPPITGLGFGAPVGQGPATFPPGVTKPTPPHPGHFTSGATSDPVGSKVANSSHAGGVDALDSFDIPSGSVSSMDDIDDINLKQSVGGAGGKTVIVAKNNGSSVWPKNQDLDKELDRVLESQQLNGNSLQSLDRGEPFSTKSGASPHGLGVKSVSVDISSLPTYDSGLGSMPSSNISSDNKKSLQNNNGTSQKADVMSAANNNNTVAGSAVKVLPVTNGGQIGGTMSTSSTTKCVTQSEESTASSVDKSETESKTNAIPSVKGDSISEEKVVVKDFADGIDRSTDDKLTRETDNKETLEKGKSDHVPSGDSVERKSQVIEVDIRDKVPKQDLVGNMSQSNEEAIVTSVEYQKLLARYKIVHNACKNFQEKRKNMKSMVTQTFVLKVRTAGMNTEPFMEFEELKVIKERLQGTLRDTMQKYMQLQMTSTSQMDAMKATLEKKESKEKELTVALTEAKRMRESDLKQWQIEKSCFAEDTKSRDSKIRDLESEKNILQNQLTTKDRELEELRRKTQVDKDLWIAEKMKLQEAFQATERAQKLLLHRAVEGEILLLQERAKMGSQALESWLREGEFHLNNFKINLQRTPDNLKMKEGFSQWHKAVTENKQKLDQLKSKYEEQIREIHSGRQLSQITTIEVPQITKPTLPPLPPPGAFMGRPGFIPPHGQPGIRPPHDMTRPPHVPQSTPSPVNSSPSPSPSPTLTQATTNSTPSQPISVPVSLAEVRSSNSSQTSENGKMHTGPAKVSPAQVTVPLQEQAPWPPAAQTPAHTSPPGFPTAPTAPSVIPTAGGSAGNNLGAVGAGRQPSVSGANATPGNNRPVKPPTATPTPAAAAGGPTPAAPVSQQAQPRTNFERILFPLQSLFPQHNQVQLTKAIKEVRQANNGSLSGLSVDEIIRRSASVLKRQPPMRAAATPATTGATSGANKGWQASNGQVPQGQRLVQGVMQGMAAQQGKFQWSSELGGSSAFKGKGFLDDDEDPCVICHEEMTPETIKILDCGHRFHAECIKQWLNEQSTCPNCRNYTLLPDEYPSL